MSSAWEQRGAIADELLKKWNAPSGWDRGRFHGEVLGWVMMTVLIIIVTVGESAAASAAGLATRFPQTVKLLETTSFVNKSTRNCALTGTTMRHSKTAAFSIQEAVSTLLPGSSSREPGDGSRNTRNAVHKVLV